MPEPFHVSHPAASVPDHSGKLSALGVEYRVRGRKGTLKAEWT